MTIGAFETYRAKIAAPTQTVFYTQNSLTVTAGRFSSGWLAGPNVGVAPTTAAVPARDIAGAIGQQNPLGTMRLGHMHFSRAASGFLVLCDRLSHQGGLAGNSAAAQTTNLPTAALTRYTTGEGVLACLEIYSLIGTTATTVTASYTNQAGTAGRTSVATVWGGTAFREANRVVFLPLQAGDTGVRAVASVTQAATTGTAGNYGVTLIKPIIAVPVVGGALQDHDALLGLTSQMQQVFTDACLFWLHMSVTTVTGVQVANLEFIED